MDARVLDHFRLPEPYADHSPMVRDHSNPTTERIDSVMPGMVREVNLFRDRLGHGELHNFDFLDVLQEVWLELRIKDHYFDPARGFQYITFATRICRNKLGEIRNRWHTVAGPRNTPARLRGDEDDDYASIERVRRTVREVSTLSVDPPDLLADDEPGEAEAQALEAQARRCHAVAAALAQLRSRHPAHAYLLRGLYGLGEPEQEIAALAAQLGLSIAQALTMKAEAQRALGAILADLEGEDFLDLEVP
jgi:hypothetical protein